MQYSLHYALVVDITHMQSNQRDKYIIVEYISSTIINKL